MPSIFRVGKYLIYFWSNENDEPIHVHIGTGKPSANSTKVWMTRAGGCVLDNNKSRIPQNELNELLDIIAAQNFIICKAWKEHFCVDTIKYYC